jgi:hypothetical protein
MSVREGELLTAMYRVFDAWVDGLDGPMRAWVQEYVVIMRTVDLPKSARLACKYPNPQGAVEQLRLNLAELKSILTEEMARHARATRGRRSGYERPKPPDPRDVFSEDRPVQAIDILRAAAKSKGEPFDEDEVMRRNGWLKR